MNVRDLIVKLSAMDPNMEVWASSDAEGNSFNDLSWVTEENVNVYEREVISDEDLEYYDRTEMTRAVVLWP